MRVLIVSWYFPPANTIAAVRMQGMAAYLRRQGAEVRVLTAAGIPWPQTLETDVPETVVTATPWADVPTWASRVKAALGTLVPRRRQRAAGAVGRSDAPAPAAAPEATAAGGGWLERLRELVFFPDVRWGWIPYAIPAGRRLIRGWRPDVIYASGPPFSTLAIGWWLSRRTGVPLVSEFRDRWSDDPYYPPSALRQQLDRWLEGRVVAASSALVTVSEPWAARYRERFAKPTLVVYNGHDPALADADRPTPRSGDRLEIVYTGAIYPGRRDPSLLFQAIALLADPQRVRVDFYATDPDQVWPLADRAGVRACVRVHPGLPHPESVRLQCAADVLLLMQWSDPREQGNVPGKLFEYLGARRPILLIGLEGGVPDSLIREREAGHLARDPEQIRALLASWIEQKQRPGGIPLLPVEVTAGLSRDAQFAQLPAFLASVTRGPAAAMEHIPA